MERGAPQHDSPSGLSTWRMTGRLGACGTRGMCPGIIRIRYVGESEGTGAGRSQALGSG